MAQRRPTAAAAAAFAGIGTESVKGTASLVSVENHDHERNADDDVRLAEDGDDSDLELQLELTAYENDNDNDNDDDDAHTAFIRDQHKTRHDRRYQKWKTSPFAVGFTEATWMDERTRDHRDRSLPPDDTGCLCCSAQVCPLFGAARVGNMAVLKQSVEWVEMLVPVDDQDCAVAVEHGQADAMDRSTPATLHAATGASSTSSNINTNNTNAASHPKMVLRRVARPRLDIVLGPYWPMLFGVTYPLILAVSGWTMYSGLIQAKHPTPWLVWLVFFVLTTSLIVALACTGLRDPGILLRTRTTLHLADAANASTWRWSDLADSFRPRNAWYDSDTAVIVDGFDHTCPWTGTAIGRKNMFAFQMFVCLVFLCMIMDIFILTGAFRH